MSLRTVLRWAGSLIGAGGVALCITIVSESMRSVMKIGGVCASGAQAFTVAHPCPAGVPGLLTGSIFAGLAFLTLFAVCVGDRGRCTLLLAWSALFLALGWNFLDFGLHPTGGGTSIGFLVCAVVFILMGGVPLLYTVPQCLAALRGRDDDSTSSSAPKPFTASTGVQFTSPGSWPATGTTPTMSPTVWPVVTPAPAKAPTVASTAAGGDVATALERLASLHASGELSDTEYEEAKRKTLENPRST